MKVEILMVIDSPILIPYFEMDRQAAPIQECEIFCFPYCLGTILKEMRIEC